MFLCLGSLSGLLGLPPCPPERPIRPPKPICRLASVAHLTPGMRHLDPEPTSQIIDPERRGPGNWAEGKQVPKLVGPEGDKWISQEVE